MKKHVDNVQDFAGNAISGVTVTIRVTVGQALATIFSDDGVTPLANPFTNDSDGEFFFFAANGEYDIILSGAAAETRPNITLFDPDDALIRGPVLVGATPGPTLIVIGQMIVADVTANAVILTLPPDPGAGVQFPDIVVQHLVGDITVNNITVQRNGELIGGVAADLVLNSPNESVRLIWAGSANGWAVQRIGDGSSAALGGLTDVTLTAPVTGGLLYKSAGDWLNTAAILVDPVGIVEVKNNAVPVARTTTVAAGGLTVDNQLTGGGFERVLTTSDAGVAAAVGVTSGPGTYYKTGDLSRTNNTASADDELDTGTTLDGTARYRFKAVLKFTCASATPDVRVGINGNTVADFAVAMRGQDAHSVAFGENVLGDTSDTLGSLATFAMDGTDILTVTIDGFCSFTSGGAASRALNVVWAQNTTDATALILKENSWFEVLKIADI